VGDPTATASSKLLRGFWRWERVHITGSASAAVYGGGIPGIIQTNPIQLFDFVSDLFDFRSQLSASPTCSTWL
jgi:hypothetical protein